MNPTEDSYSRWAVELHRRHRPAFEAQRARHDADRTAAAHGPDALRAECARLTEQVAAASARVRAATLAALDSVSASLSSSRAEAVRQAMTEFPRLFPPGAAPPSPAIAAGLFAQGGAGSPEDDRARIRAAFTAAANLVAGQGAVLAKVADQQARESQVAQEIAATRAVLVERHAVQTEVLDGLKALHSDADFRDLCAGLAADAALEAGWNMPADPLAAVRRTGGCE